MSRGGKRCLHPFSPSAGAESVDSVLIQGDVQHDISRLKIMEVAVQVVVGDLRAGAGGLAWACAHFCKRSRTASREEEKITAIKPASADSGSGKTYD